MNVPPIGKKHHHVFHRTTMSSAYLVIPLPSAWWCVLWWIWLFDGPRHRWHRGIPHSLHKIQPLRCCHHRSYRPTVRQMRQVSEADGLYVCMYGHNCLTWAVLFTVLLGASNESFTNTFSITSTSMHSCLHTGQRITFTGTEQNHTCYSMSGTVGLYVTGQKIFTTKKTTLCA